MQIKKIMLLTTMFMFSVTPTYAGSTFGDDTRDDAEASTITKRAKLKVVNATQEDEGGPKRDLHIEWGGDVHQPPQYTERLTPGESDEKPSKGVGNGHNYRNFDLRVSRWKDNDKRFIGHYVVGVYTEPFGSGGKGTTKIFKNYTATHVQLWGTYLVGDEDGPREVNVPIGSIPREVW